MGGVDGTVVGRMLRVNWDVWLHNMMSTKNSQSLVDIVLGNASL